MQLRKKNDSLCIVCNSHVRKIEIESQTQSNFSLIQSNLFFNSLTLYKKEGNTVTILTRTDKGLYLRLMSQTIFRQVRLETATFNCLGQLLNKHCRRHFATSQKFLEYDQSLMTSWMHTNTLANTKTPHVCGTNIPPRNTLSI